MKKNNEHLTDPAKVLKALEERNRINQGFRSLLFDKQLQFIQDPNRLKGLQCSRRSGKSTVLGAYLFYEAFNTPGSTCIYLGLTRETARKIMIKDIIQPWNENLKINATITTHPYISVTLPNKSVIYILGIDKDREQAHKLFGQKFRLVVVDEAASFTQDLEEIVYKVIQPATMDYSGTVVLAGTTQNNIHSFFFKVTNNLEPGWSIHKWTGFDNPHMKDLIEAEVRDMEKRNPLVKETAYFRQMYLNEWVVDTSRLIYHYNPELNSANELPKANRWVTVFGIDLGFTDDTAITVLSYSYEHRACYIRACWKRAGLDITSVATKIKELALLYKPAAYIVDGASKQAIEEIKNRHRIPLQNAEKVDKSEFMHLFNDELKQGYVKVIKGNGTDILLKEWSELVYAENSSTEEDPGIPNHLCFIPGMEVHTYDGIKPIEKVCIGDKVIDDNGQWVEVTNTMSRHYEGDIVGLNIVGNQETLWCTPEHELKVVDLKRSYTNKRTGQLTFSKEYWKAASEVLLAEPNNKIRTGVKKASINSDRFKLHKSTAFMLGYYVAEGSLGGDGSQICFAGHQKENTVIPILEEAISRLKRRSNSRRIKQYNSKVDKGRTLIFGNVNLAKKLKKLGTFTSKHFPRWVSLLDRETSMYVLLGYLFGDGHFSPQGVKANSISKDIIYQVSLLCQKIGLTYNIHKATRAGKYKGYGPNGLVLNDTYNIQLSKESTNLILEFINRNLNYCFSSKLIHNFDIKYKLPDWRKQYSYVNKKEFKKYKGPVYTLETKSGSYNVNGIIVKNCDSTLYAWRYCYNYYSKVKERPLEGAALLDFQAAQVKKAVNQPRQEKDWWEKHDKSGDWDEDF